MDAYNVGQLAAAALILCLSWVGWKLIAFVVWFIRGTPTERINPPSYYRAEYSEDVNDNEGGVSHITDPADDPFNNRTVYESFDSVLANGRTGHSKRKNDERKVKAKRNKSKHEDIRPDNGEMWK